MGAFAYRKTRTGHLPARLRSAVVSAWHSGDTIPLGREMTRRVIDTRLRENPDGDPVLVLVVEPT